MSNDFKVVDMGQCINDFFVNFIIKIFVIWIIVVVDEGQYGNRLGWLISGVLLGYELGLSFCS